MAAGPLFPQGRELPRLICPRRPLTPLSANPAAAFWKSLTPIALRENLTGRPPHQATGIRLAADSDELRILFDALDRDPSATITERDGPLWKEEVVELFLDPQGDGDAYFEIELNPLGTVLDLVIRRVRNGFRKDLRWNCEGLRTIASRTATGWAAEFAVPFRSVSAHAPRNGACWRANFLRIDRPPGKERELSAWSPTFCGTFHVPARFGVVAFD